MVMEAFDEGFLDEVRVKEGESAKVGAVIATLRGADEASQPPAERPPAPTLDVPPAAEQLAQTNGGSMKSRDGESPLAEGLELATTESSRGRVAPMRQIRRRRGSIVDAEKEIPETSSPPALEPEVTQQDKSLRYHPAVSAVQSAAPTAIAAAPHQALALAELHEAPAAGDGKLRASPLARRAA